MQHPRIILSDLTNPEYSYRDLTSSFCVRTISLYLNLLFQIFAIQDGEGANTWATLRVWGCPGERQGPYSQGSNINYQTFNFCWFLCFFFRPTNQLWLIFVFFSRPTKRSMRRFCSEWRVTTSAKGWALSSSEGESNLFLKNLKVIQNWFYAGSFLTSLTSASRVLTLCLISVRTSTPWLGCRSSNVQVLQCHPSPFLVKTLS